jgi:hypothetical protein
VSLRLTALLAVAVAACCGGAAAAVSSPPSVRIVGRAPQVEAGRLWSAAIQVSGSDAKPSVLAMLGRLRVRASLRRQRAGRFRMTATFPAAGRWRLVARLGPRTIRLGAILVTPGELLLAEPGQALAFPDGSFLVAERASRDRVLRVAPGGSARVFARGLDDPFGLAAAADGSVLVSTSRGIYRIRDGGVPELVASVRAGPIAQSPLGDIFYAEAQEVGRISAGGIVHRYAVEVEVPHGLVYSADGTLAVADSGHDRILRLDPGSGAASVVAGSLDTPLALVEEPSGALLVAEYRAGKVTRVTAVGRTTVASGLRNPYALARTLDGTVYVVEAGSPARPSGRVKRVAPDGTVQQLRLTLASK